MSETGRPRAVRAPCGCAGWPDGPAVVVRPCPLGRAGRCPAYRVVLLYAAVRDRPVVVDLEG